MGQRSRGTQGSSRNWRCASAGQGPRPVQVSDVVPPSPCGSGHERRFRLVARGVAAAIAVTFGVELRKEPWRDPNEAVDERGVEVDAALGAELVERLLERPALLVGALADEGV